MSVIWDDINARARGLSTALMDRALLERLAASPDLTALAAGLERQGYGPAAAERAVPGATAAGLDRALRRGVAARLRVLQRWCGERAAVLAVLFEDEDRRSLRALLRGAAAGVTGEERLAGLVPTPSLPAGLLEELADQRTPALLATLLTARGHPYGPVLLPEAARAHPDPLLLELALDRRFAERALRAARRAGPALLAYTREGIDLENAVSALVLAGGRSERPPADFFLAGGERLTRPIFLTAAGSGGRIAAAGVLGRLFAPTPYGDILLGTARDPGAVEQEILRARIRAQHRAARLDPLGPAVTIGYVLRLRAEAIDLRLIAWGLVLAPAAPVQERSPAGPS